MGGDVSDKPPDIESWTVGAIVMWMDDFENPVPVICEHISVKDLTNDGVKELNENYGCKIKKHQSIEVLGNAVVKAIKDLRQSMLEGSETKTN